MDGLFSLRTLQDLLKEERNLKRHLDKTSKEAKSEQSKLLIPYLKKKRLYDFSWWKDYAGFLAFGCGIYVVAYIAAAILDVLIILISFPLRLFDVDIGAWGDKILHFTGAIVTVPGSLIYKLFTRSWLYSYELGDVVIGFLITAAMLFVALIATNLVLIAIKNPVLKAENEKIPAKNEEIKTKNAAAIREWKNTDDFRKRNQRIKSLESKLQDVENKIFYNDVVHDDYKNIVDIGSIIWDLERGRASSIKEAINLMHSDRQREYYEEQRLEETRKTRIATEKSAEYSRQTAKNSKIAAEAAEEAREAAQQASDRATANLGATFGLAYEMDKHFNN